MNFNFRICIIFEICVIMFFSSLAKSIPAGCPYYPPAEGEISYKYIIITNEQLADPNYYTENTDWTFQALCDSKSVRGISSCIVTTEWIYANYDPDNYDPNRYVNIDDPAWNINSDNAIRIRMFLIDAYETWETEYVLLGGNKNVIPIRTLYEHLPPGGPPQEVPSDLYYACVSPADDTFNDYTNASGNKDIFYGANEYSGKNDEADISPELLLGRALVDTPSEVVNFVKKTLTYQELDVRTESIRDYLETILFSGGWLGNPDPVVGSVAEFGKPHAECIRTGYHPTLENKIGFKNASEGCLGFNSITFYDQPDLPSDWIDFDPSNYEDKYKQPVRGWVPNNNIDWCDGWEWSTAGIGKVWNTLFEYNNMDFQRWTASDLINLINGDTENPTPHIIYHIAHGNIYYNMKLYTDENTFGIGNQQTNTEIYGTLYNSNNSEYSLSNENYFLIYSDSCWTGAYDNEDCWSEAMLSMPFGAFAVISYSNQGVTDVSDENFYKIEGISLCFARDFFDLLLDNKGPGQRFELGYLLSESKKRHLARIDEPYSRIAYYGQHLFGDPELRLHVHCYPNNYPTFNNWLNMERPLCWCPVPNSQGYQCDGDADGEEQGILAPIRIGSMDLSILNEAWLKTDEELLLIPNGVCADFDHESEGVLIKNRVYHGDLSILLENWQKESSELPGDCPRVE